MGTRHKIGNMVWQVADDTHNDTYNVGLILDVHRVLFTNTNAIAEQTTTEIAHVSGMLGHSGDRVAL